MMYDDLHTVAAIHRDRMEQLRRTRNPRRGWRGGPERNPKRRPRSDREL